MTRRQAQAYQHADDGSYSSQSNDDLERHAEEAARKAGKSVEEWLHDLIIDQSASNPTRVNARQSTDAWKGEAILADLADRVNALEGSFDTPGAPIPHATHRRMQDESASYMGRNHDEDARTLIEGIRARANQKNAYRTEAQSGPLTNAAPTPGQNQQADRLMEMLDTISFLEKRIKGEGRERAAPNRDDRLAQLSDKLAMLEQSLDDDRDDAPYSNDRNDMRGKRRTAMRNRRDYQPDQVQGRRAVRETMQAIADRETGTRFNGMTYVPKNRAARTAPRRKEADRHYQTLVAKLDEIREGTPSIAAIQALKDDFASLRDIVNKDAQKGTKAELKRLRNTLYKMQNQINSAFDDARLQNLEGDVNRIAEYLLTKQADGPVAPDFTGLYQELARLSDGLTAVTDRAEAASRDNSNLVVVRIEDSLATLREDIMRQMQESAAGAPVPQNLFGDLDLRLNGITHDISQRFDHVNQHMSDGLRDLSGQMASIGQEMTSTRARLDALNVEGSGNDPLMESRLLAGIDQRFAQVDQQVGDGIRDLSGQVAQLGEAVATTHSRIDALGAANDQQDSAMSEHVEAVEGRLLRAAERLEQASLEAAKAQGEIPAHLLAPATNAVTDEVLRSELGRVTTQVNSEMAANQSTMMARIDHAISSLSDVISQTPPPVIEGNQADDGAMRGYMDEIRQTTHYLSEGTSASLLNVQTSLDGLAERLASLEAIANAAAAEPNPADGPPMAPSMDVSGLQNDMEELKSSTAALTQTARSSFDEMQHMLHRVTDRLDALENTTVSTPIQSNARSLAALDPLPKDDPVMRSMDDHDNYVPDTPTPPPFNAADLGEDGLINADTPIPPKPAIVDDQQTGPSDEEIMRRMREHVKARDPEAPMLQMTDDDVPLEPGSGKPDFNPVDEDDSLLLERAPAMEQRVDVNNDQFEDTTFNPRAEASFMEPDDQEEPEGPKSKADFIAAARRAAQAAAREEAEMEGPSTETKSALASFRDRLSAVTGRKRKTVLDDDQRGDEPKLDDDPVVLKNIEPSSDRESGTDDALIDELIEPRESDSGEKSHMLRRALVPALVFAIAGVGYFALKEPIGNLIAGLTGTETRTNFTGRAVNPPENPSTTRPLPAKPDAKDAAPGSALYEPNNAIEAAKDAAREALTKSDKNALVDPTTTAAISPDTATAPVKTNDIFGDKLAPEVVAALEALPADRVSDKHVDALLNAEAAAFFELARRFGTGDGFTRDLKKAAFWYEQAAKSGMTIAEFRIAAMYEDGNGVAKNPKKARAWYEKAAEGGNARAMHNLAVLYAEGSLGAPDFDKAFNWFKKGAEFGIKDSQFNVGILYVRGLGVTADLVEAYRWFDVVAKSGDKDAAIKRNEIAKALTPSQLEAGKSLSASYKKKKWDATANVPTPAPASWSVARVAPGLAVSGTPSQKTLVAPSEKGTQLVYEVQRYLNGLGFDAGKPDGVMGKKTREAIRSFEYEMGKRQTGEPTKKLLRLLKEQRA